MAQRMDIPLASCDAPQPRRHVPRRRVATTLRHCVEAWRRDRGHRELPFAPGGSDSGEKKKAYE
jgi:hypothetical protein